MGEINEMKDLDIYQLEEMANEGNLDAASELSRRYFEGDGVAINYELAKSYQELLSKNNGHDSKFSRNEQSVLFDKWLEEKKEFENTSLARLQEYADSGNPFALIKLSDMYFNLNSDTGNRQSYNYLKAAESILENYLSANDDDNAKALLSDVEIDIGDFYFDGYLEDENLKHAISYYKNAYDIDDTKGERLAECYRNGYGCETDLEYAKVVEDKYLAKDYFEDYFNLALEYIQIDRLRATILFQKSLNAHDCNECKPSLINIAKMYLLRLNEKDIDGKEIDRNDVLKQLDIDCKNLDYDAIISGIKLDFLSSKYYESILESLSVFPADEANTIRNHLIDKYKEKYRDLFLLDAENQPKWNACVKDYNTQLMKIWDTNKSSSYEEIITDLYLKKLYEKAEISYDEAKVIIEGLASEGEVILCRAFVICYCPLELISSKEGKQYWNKYCSQVNDDRVRRIKGNFDISILNEECDTDYRIGKRYCIDNNLSDMSKLDEARYLISWLYYDCDEKDLVKAIIAYWKKEYHQSLTLESETQYRKEVQNRAKPHYRNNESLSEDAPLFVFGGLVVFILFVAFSSLSSGLLQAFAIIFVCMAALYIVGVLM